MYDKFDFEITPLRSADLRNMILDVHQASVMGGRKPKTSPFADVEKAVRNATVSLRTTVS